MRIEPLQTENSAGFPFATLVVVVAMSVIGYLAQEQWTEQRARVPADIRAITHAVERYNAMNAGRYPELLDDLLLTDIQGYSSVRKESLPKDPWGNEYLYDPPSSRSSADYRIYTYGADGRVGGEGDDRDYDQIMLRELLGR